MLIKHLEGFHLSPNMLMHGFSIVMYGRTKGDVYNSRMKANLKIPRITFLVDDFNYIHKKSLLGFILYSYSPMHRELHC